MNSIIETIVTIANQLDDSGNDALADTLDSFAQRLTDIKVAQYVGSQGYWMRNTRCWANCYREKRAKNPNMPAQEVWTSCHEEYVTAMQNENSGKSTASWDKYASSNKKSSYDGIFDDEFNKLIESHVESGMDRGHAIFAAIDDMEMKPYDDLVEASQQAFDLAAEMFDKSPREAVKIAQAGEELIKEAQWWRRRMNDMAAPARGLRQMWNPAVMDSKSQGSLFKSINSLTRAMQTVVQEKNNLVNLARQSGMEQIAQEIETQIPQDSLMQIANGLTRVNQFAQDVTNRETGGERGNAVQRGLNWLGNQQQQGADKARQSDEFFANQRGENSGEPQSPQSNFVGQGLDGQNFDVQNVQPQDSSYQTTDTSNIVGPGMNPQPQAPRQPQAPQQEPKRSPIITPSDINQSVIQSNPILRTHASMVPTIVSVAPDMAALDRLFAPYLGNRPQIQSDSKSSDKIKKTANDPQNNGGDLRSQVEQYLNGLDSRDVIALYEALKELIQSSQGEASYSGDSTHSSYSSSKKQVKASVGKTFNLSKFRDGGATQ